MVRSVSGTRACDEGVFFSFLFFSIRGSRRRSISGLSANLLSPLFSLLSLKQHFLYSISFHPYHVDFFRVLFPHRWVFTHCCYEWMVGVRKRREGKKRGEVGKTQKGGGGEEGKKRDEGKGDEETCRSDKQCLFPLPRFFSSFTQSSSPRSSLHFTLSRTVPSRPVPSRPFPLSLFPRAFTPSLSLLISYHAPSLSFPFLPFPFTLPPHSPPSNPPTHPLSFTLRPSITHTSIKSFPL